MRKTIWFLQALLRLGLFAGIAAFASGCDSDLDQDTLVRELRVLAMRVSVPATDSGVMGDPGSVSEVQGTLNLSMTGPMGTPDLALTSPSLQVEVLAAAPAGLGRRAPAPVSGGPRPLRYDWFACIGPLSLFSPGSLDPKCQKFAPGDPPPRENPSLRALSDAPSPSPILALAADGLKEILAQFVSALLASFSGGSPGGGAGGSFMLPSHPIVLLLPVLVQVTVPAPDGDPTSSLDSEVAYTFLRIVIALPGMSLPPPNHNPMVPADGAVQVGPEIPEMGPPDPSVPTTRLMPCANPSFGDCPRFPITRTDPVFVTAGAAMGSIETYDPLDDSGRAGVAETMRYTWFSTDGTFEDERTGDMHPQTKWQNMDKRPAPPQVSVVDLWLVVQDERGGVDFQRFQLSFP